MRRESRWPLVFGGMLCVLLIVARPILGWLIGPLGVSPDSAIRWLGPLVSLGWLVILALVGLVVLGTILVRRATRSGSAEPSAVQPEKALDMVTRRFRAEAWSHPDTVKTRPVLHR
jgi:hypothetical protein